MILESLTDSEVARLKTDLLCQGIRVPVSEPYYSELVPREYPGGGKSRAGVAGSGRIFWLEYGETANLGVRQAFLEDSIYEFRIMKGEGWILRGGEPVIRATVKVPLLHSCPLSDKFQIHGRGSLATALTNTCIYKAKPSWGCKFCIIDVGDKKVIHHPADLAGALREIREHPELLLVEDLVKKYGYGSRQGEVEREKLEITDININSGTLAGGGASYFVEVVKALRREWDLPIGIQICPLDRSDLKTLKEAGVTEISFNLEVFNKEYRERVIPGKDRDFPRERYFRAIAEACEIFGANQVESWIIIGLEPPEETIAGIEAIARAGGIPLPRPFRPLLGSDYQGYPPPSVEDAVKVYRAWAEVIKRFGLWPEKTAAGCGKCNSCFPLREVLRYGI